MQTWKQKSVLKKKKNTTFLMEKIKIYDLLGKKKKARHVLA